jgi:hypothetical protein
METSRRYDIVRREKRESRVLAGRRAGTGRCKIPVEELLSFWPGEYQIFDLETREVVLTSSCLRRANRHASQQFR